MAPVPKQGLIVRNSLVRSGTKRTKTYAKLCCLRCGDFSDRPCPTHSKYIPDAPVVPFALASLPEVLDFVRPKSSDLPAGVKAKHLIPEQTIFGPVRGVACPYAQDEDLIFAVPAVETSTSMDRFYMASIHACNWTKYLRPAFEPGEQNVAVYADENAVYFVTTKEIASNEELKVSYSLTYAELLGFDNFDLPKGLDCVDGAYVDDGNVEDAVFPETGNLGSPGPLSDEKDDVELPLLSEAGDVEADVNTGTETFPAATEKLRKRSRDRSKAGGPKGRPKRVFYKVGLDRLRAVVEINPYQYSGKERARAWEDAAQLTINETLEPAKTERARIALQHFVKQSLQSFSSQREHLTSEKAQSNEVYEYVNLMDQIVGLQAIKLTRASDTAKKRIWKKDTVQIPRMQLTKPSTEGIYPCSGCSVSYKSEALLALHNLGHNAAEIRDVCDPELSCPECKESFVSITGLIAHVVEHQQTYHPRIQCDLCQLYILAPLFAQHKRAMHPEAAEGVSEFSTSQCACDKCGKDFVTMKRYTSHMHSAHILKRCVFCAMMFSNGTELGQHALSHKEADGFHCPSCSTVRKTYVSVSRHFRESHDIGALCFCPVCNIMIQNRKKLKKHMVSHSEEFNHHCEFCGKRFKSQSNLRHHLRWTHGTRAKEKYKQQKETVPPKKYVAARKRIQYEDFPYKCEECRVGFLRQGRWVRHKMVYHGAA